MSPNIMTSIDSVGVNLGGPEGIVEVNVTICCILQTFCEVVKSLKEPDFG